MAVKELIDTFIVIDNMLTFFLCCFSCHNSQTNDELDWIFSNLAEQQRECMNCVCVEKGL